MSLNGRCPFYDFFPVTVVAHQLRHDRSKGYLSQCNPEFLADRLKFVPIREVFPARNSCSL